MCKSDLVCQRSMFGAFLLLILIVFERIDYDYEKE
jgi:hypothetical protein